MENALFALLAPAQDEEAACLAAVREAAARHGLSVTPEEALAASTEPWMVQRVYSKLTQRAAAYMAR